MKFITLFAFLLPVFVFAQSIDVYVDGTNVEFSGWTHTILTYDSLDADIALILNNSSGQDQNWYIERVLPAVQNWNEETMSMFSYFEPFAGPDYMMPPNPIWVTPDSLIVPPGDSARLFLTYAPETNGCDLYSYYLRHDNVRVDSFNIYLCNTLSLDEINPFNVSTYPNPANTEITISFNDQIPNQVKFFDLFGKEIATFVPQKSMKISTEEFSEGVYFLTWEIEGENYNRKIIVQH